MKKIILGELLKFYGKQMGTSLFYIGALLVFPFSVLMKVVADIHETYTYMDFASLLDGLVIPMQGIMLLVAVYMYRLVADEIQYRQSILFPDIVRIQYQRVIAILMNHALFTGMALLFGATGMFVYFHQEQVPWSSFQLDILRHILIFYFLPLVLAALWGINCAMIFGKQKIGMLVLVLIWVFLGPLNTEFFSAYFYEGGLEGDRSFLFIGPLQPGSVYVPLVGYLGNQALLLKIFIHIVLQSIILFLLIGQWHLRLSRQWMTVVISLLVLCLLIIISPYALANNQQTFDRSHDAELAQHYKTPYRFQPNHKNLDYTIQKMNLTLNPVENQIETEAELKIQSDQAHIVLSLWHEYHITSVSAGQKKLQYKQYGDFISMSLPPQARTHTVTIRYQLHNSPHFPVTEEEWYLPATTNWYPARQVEPINRLGVETLDLIVDRSNLMNVRITGELPNDLVSNLTRQDENTYIGRVSGVTLLRGNLSTYEARGIQIVTDSSWSNPSTYWLPVEQVLKHTNTVIRRTFGKKVIFPDKVVLISPNLERNSFCDSHHLLLQVGTNLRLDQSLNEVIAAYVPGLMWSETSSHVKIDPKWKLFNAALAYWLQIELKLEPIEIDSFYLQQTGRDMKQLNGWIKMFSDRSHDQQLVLLQKWYRELNAKQKGGNRDD
ncbi:hypothetical protein [Exiguobacterium sp. ERU656]|uniref:hypothetical protein n=1 Tax=Exiguobacterium sp. ERU656 TaxID=2751217 RepID=UPI001BEC19F2|nr:hypothetical protein [Exiguobacterium sp. ERU656]